MTSLPESDRNSDSDQESGSDNSGSDKESGSDKSGSDNESGSGSDNESGSGSGSGNESGSDSGSDKSGSDSDSDDSSKKKKKKGKEEAKAWKPDTVYYDVMSVLRSVLFDLDLVTKTVDKLYMQNVSRPKPQSFSPPRNYYPPVRKDSEEGVRSIMKKSASPYRQDMDPDEEEDDAQSYHPTQR